MITHLQDTGPFFGREVFVAFSHGNTISSHGVALGLGNHRFSNVKIFFMLNMGKFIFAHDVYELEIGLCRKIMEYS